MRTASGVCYDRADKQNIDVAWCSLARLGMWEGRGKWNDDCKGNGCAESGVPLSTVYRLAHSDYL